MLQPHYPKGLQKIFYERIGYLVVQNRTCKPMRKRSKEKQRLQFQQQLTHMNRTILVDEQETSPSKDGPLLS